MSLRRLAEALVDELERADAFEVLGATGQGQATLDPSDRAAFVADVRDALRNALDDAAAFYQDELTPGHWQVPYESH